MPFGAADVAGRDGDAGLHGGDRSASRGARPSARARWIPAFAVPALAFLAALAAPAAAQRAPLAWPAITRDAKPWTRWWWLGSAVDSAGLTAELRQLADAGFGGVEVTAIYGARGAESAYVPYLTRRWVGMLGHASAEARRLGMAVDVPPGSGWRMGGPNVAEDDVNASLRVTADTVRDGGEWIRDLSGRFVEGVVAVSDAGQVVDVAVARGPQAGPLRWRAPAGTWVVYVAEMRFSGDNVKRPAPGGAGRSIDVFSRAAVTRYLGAFGDSLAPLGRGALRAFFHDSFEYSGDGSRELLAAFRTRRGYDLLREIAALAGHGPADRVARVKSDYRQTIDEMLLERFAMPFADWARARGGVSRVQAHGSPGNLLDLYAAADIPETEIFGPLGHGDNDPLVSKFASSAAHVAGRPRAAAEAFTWLGEHWTATLDDVKQAADQLFVSGIDHLVYHGTAYSPPGAAWPGWQFYASAEFNARNAFWRDLPALNTYVARVQASLQATRADNDVLLYWPIWDSWHDPARMRMDFRVHDPKWLHDRPLGAAAAELWRKGWGFDYVSDRLLAERVTASGGRLRAGLGASWRAVVVPRAERMPPETLDRLLALAHGGATIAFLGGVPADVPGLARADERRARLAAAARRVALGPADGAGVRRAAVGAGQVLVGPTLDALLGAAGVRREPLVDHAGLRFIRRRHAAGHEYFVSHAGGAAVDGWVPLAVGAAAVAILDPMSGRAGLAQSRRAANGGTEVRLLLAPGGSLLLRTFERAVPAARWAYREPDGAPLPLHGRWSVAFMQGGPTLPTAFDADAPTPWTARGDSIADAFAGTARYTLRFDAPGSASRWLLDLGRVAESARVTLNGRALGTLVARPFAVETGPLRAAGNVLEVEVTNLSANRVRDLDRRAVPWKIFHDINVVGLDYRPLDASTWAVRPSGLAGPVTLTPLR